MRLTHRGFKYIISIVFAIISILLWGYALLNMLSVVDWTIQSKGALAKAWNYAISPAGTVQVTGGLVIFVLVLILMDRERERRINKWRQLRERAVKRRLERAKDRGLLLQAEASTKQQPTTTVTPAERRIFAKRKPVDDPKLLDEPITKKKRRSLACRRAHIIAVELFNGVVSEKKEARESDLHAAVVEFVNSPKAKGWVGQIEYLSAQITFYDSKGNYFHRNASCHWIGHERRYVHLGADGIAKLVIAFGGSHWKKFVMNNENEVHIAIRSLDHKEPVELVGESFQVQVCLSASNGLNEISTFELTTNPFDIKESEEEAS